MVRQFKLSKKEGEEYRALSNRNDDSFAQTIPYPKPKTLAQARANEQAILKGARKLKSRVERYYVSEFLVPRVKSRLKTWTLEDYTRPSMFNYELKSGAGGKITGYKKGVSCGRGNHQYVSRGTYLVCKKCGASKTLGGGKPRSSLRSKISRA